MAKVFISHSSKDKEFAASLANDLRDLGHEPWLDQWKIRVGDCIPSEIERGVSGSDYVVVVLTPDAVSSGWVEKEWKTKYWEEIEKSKICVLPVLLKDCDVPPLLKIKKYADFATKTYAVALTQLVQAITPVYIESSQASYVKDTTDDRDVSKLLTKVQGKQTPLSQCIAEALPIAQKHKDKEFVDFCKKELAGWEAEGEITPDEKLRYRLAEVLCSPIAKVNLEYWGWGGSVSTIFSYMENHPDQFFPAKMLITWPISDIEEKASADPEKGFLSWTQPFSDFAPHSKKPDAKVFCYARTGTFRNVLDGLRAEVTKRLLNLLPPIKQP